MEINQIRRQIEPNIKFYDGISLNEYTILNKRWDDIICIINNEIFNYVNDKDLCFSEQENLFPVKNKLTGNYYINSVTYIKHVKPLGYQIIVSTKLTERILNGEGDYLGLDITLFIKSQDGFFEVWGIDSSSI